MTEMPDLLEQELSQAGKASPFTPMTNQLDQYRVTAHMNLPPMEALFRYNDVPCFYRGEIHGIAGKAKVNCQF